MNVGACCHGFTIGGVIMVQITMCLLIMISFVIVRLFIFVMELRIHLEYLA